MCVCACMQACMCGLVVSGCMLVYGWGCVGGWCVGVGGIVCVSKHHGETVE